MTIVGITWVSMFILGINAGVDRPCIIALANIYIYIYIYIYFMHIMQIFLQPLGRDGGFPRFPSL